MGVKEFLGALIAMVFRIVIAVVVIMAVFKLAVQAYDFGFRIFAETPVSEGEGRTISVVVMENENAMEIGKMLEDRGLIKDAKIFWVQERLSNYHNMIKSGTYELNTAMTVEQMLEVMASEESETETGEAKEESQTVSAEQTEEELSSEEAAEGIE